MRQQILHRRHISAELDNLFSHPLTLAVAAMGYGKTTSAKDYLNEKAVRYTWLSIESDESSPQYIWDSLTSQLVKDKPEPGKQLRALGFPVDAPQRERVLKMIEDLVYMTNTVLVIDDYHHVHSPELDKLVERLVRMKIEGFHILILSRTVPEINIYELTLKGYCYQVKSRVFEVGAAEIKSYFEMYSHRISDDTAKQVQEISEGWVSAVYLIMQRYAETGRVEPGESIEKLIETAVMSRYTGREVLILKSLSLLENFTPAQAGYVTGEREAGKIIRRLSEENSFIRYDEINGVYRIHNILNNYLRKILAEQPENIEIADLYKRSGQWYIQNGDTISGLKYLLKAKEYDLILAEFEKSAINIVIDSNPQYILEIFQQIPMEVKYRHPIGLLAYIGFYVTNVDRNKGACLLGEIEKHYQNDNISAVVKKRIAGEIELIRAYIAFNDAALMRERMIRAHEMLEGHSLIANKDKIITFGSPHSAYLYYREKGRFSWSVRCVQEMFPYYSEMAGGCGKGFDDLLQAEYYLETGELKQAGIYARKAIYKAQVLEQVDVILCGRFVLARISLARGQMNEALEVMDDLSVEVEACSIPILSSAFDLCSGYIGAVSGTDNRIANWLKLGDIEQSEVLYQGMGFNYIVYGKYLLVQKQYIKLEVLCEEMRQVFSYFNNLLGYLHAYILEAAAKYNLYGLKEAKPAIAEALDIGRADGIIFPIAEYGLHILELLQDLQTDYEGDEYLAELVAQTTQYSVNQKRFKFRGTKKLELTKREKEILMLVTDGKTNGEIAAELFLAEVTVRKNITAIYRKLDVAGRAAAVKKALMLKIV